MPYESRSLPQSSLFLGSAPRLEPGRPALHGVPYDGTACFRPGARFGPDAIRAVSDGLESFSPRLEHDLVDAEFFDCGNLDITYHDVEKVVALVEQSTEAYLQMENVPVMIGGEHSITPGAVAAVARHYPGLAVVQFDAHADLRESWTGTKWSHACAMRRVLDLIPSERVLQCGIRSGTREEFSELKESGRLVAPDAESLATAIRPMAKAPLYLTIDLDIFDPSVLPGTGTPEPGGLDWACFEGLLEVIPWKQVAACDVVELAPELDPSGCSSILAAKVVREVLLALTKP